MCRVLFSLPNTLILYCCCCCWALYSVLATPPYSVVVLSLSSSSVVIFSLRIRFLRCRVRCTRHSLSFRVHRNKWHGFPFHTALIYNNVIQLRNIPWAPELVFFPPGSRWPRHCSCVLLLTPLLAVLFFTSLLAGVYVTRAHISTFIFYHLFRCINSLDSQYTQNETIKSKSIIDKCSTLVLVLNCPVYIIAKTWTRAVLNKIWEA